MVRDALLFQTKLVTYDDLSCRQAGMSESRFWRSTGMIMITELEAVLIAETISLGILALPAALSTLGLVPYVPPVAS